MDEQELLEFLQRILSSKNKEKTVLNLKQLELILKNNKADRKLIKFVHNLAFADREMGEIADMEPEKISIEVMQKAIKRGYERKKRMWEAEKNGRC